MRAVLRAIPLLTVPLVAVVILMGVSNLFCAPVALLLPMLTLREAFFYLPFFGYVLLTATVFCCLAVLQIKRIVAKKIHPATLQTR